MKLIIRNLLLFLILAVSFKAFSQDNNTTGSKKSAWNGKMKYQFVPSISEQIKKGTFVPARTDESSRYGKDKRFNGNKVVPGKGMPKGLDPLLSQQARAPKRKIKSTSLTFETTRNAGTPSDPTGAVGRNFYIASWNTAFRIFNKDGSPAMDAAGLETLFPGVSIGDPIVLYDSDADRYIVTEFENDPNGFHVAISETNDPINGGWHVYSADGFQTGTFPDYTKFSIWSDGYYVTANIPATDTAGNTRNGQVWALERDKMLIGDTTAGIQAFELTGIRTNGFYSPQAFNVTDGNLPAAGNATIVYMQDDAWANVDDDHLKLWTINVNWTTPANSTISAPVEIPTADFTGVFDGGSFSNLPQPSGPDIDAMQATVMNQAQFRKFPTHNSVVFNFVVNTDSTDKLAGIRWYELRQTADGQPWTIYQEGTYTALEGRHAFGASMAMDGEGNIGMGYSSVSKDQSISIRYTGRFKEDPLNTMTALEELIVLSTSDNPDERYADYSHLTVDPSNDKDFWFVTEYFNSGVRSNMVGVFQISKPLTNDIGVLSIESPSTGDLGNNESITIKVTNYGTNTQTNFPLNYSVDGNIITEMYTGSIPSRETIEYTFSTSADLSIGGREYSIEAFTGLTNDENNSNDRKIKKVSKTYCKPNSGGCAQDGIKKFILGSINTGTGATGCNTTGSEPGYADRTNLNTDLERSTGNNSYTLQAQHNRVTGGNSNSLSMWIDFNDNGTFENSEQLIKGVAFTSALSLNDFDFDIPTSAQLGSHVLRVKAMNTTSTGDVNDPCSDYGLGEVQDYKVNITDATLSTDDFDVENSEIEVQSLPNKQYVFELTTQHQDLLSFRVYDMLGKLVVFNNISKEGNKYSYSLDMSYASPGLYIVKMGGKSNFKSVKLLVK
ncbi:GEVED domain-containing protein [Tenacibaculum sp. M341]|uniref:GEVED domain-containing protein n=1 Tax=Tenacibaculum sp. M341 TaxID=2530339 RepID=UPI001053C13B|nr:GEVED domain-containing protein [Tenacibaculum sp. M341]TCI90140.1 T9SS type A sorting domain-containing protein [Tenacibaculum sp. M341]